MAVKAVICFYLFCLWLQVQAQQGVVLESSAAGEPCFGQPVTLTCRHPSPLQDTAKYQPDLPAWTENSVALDFTLSTTQERFTRKVLNSTASTMSFIVTEEYHANTVITCSCFLTLNGGGREESDPITMDVEETIQPPTLVSTPNSTPGLLQWNSPSSSCSNYNYNFTLNWTRIEDGSTGTVSTAENRYTFTINGSYTVNIIAAIVDLNLTESEPLSVDFTTPVTGPPAPTGPQTGGIPVAIPIVIVVVIVIVAIIAIAIIVVICCCRNKKKRISQSRSPVAESEYSEGPSKKQEAENVELGQTGQELGQTGQELGQTGQELDKKQEAENDQVQYAAIDFSGQMPIAPPPLETVVYTQTVEQFRNARKNRPIPPLPPAKTEEEEEEERKLAQEAAEITADFKAQVVAILQASKLVYRSLDPEEAVVGTYQKKTFVANFVHAPGGKEILSSEVEAIIKDRKLQSTDKGFLMATTDSISGPWLEHLEKHNCHFIGLSRKGGVKKEMLLKKLSFCFPESSSF